MNEKVRINAYVVPHVKEYIDSQCEMYGISQGAFISLVVTEYMKQNDALETMKTITNSDILNYLEKLDKQS